MRRPAPPAAPAAERRDGRLRRRSARGAIARVAPGAPPHPPRAPAPAAPAHRRMATWVHRCQVRDEGGTMSIVRMASTVDSNLSEPPLSIDGHRRALMPMRRAHGGASRKWPARRASSTASAATPRITAVYVATMPTSAPRTKPACRKTTDTIAMTVASGEHLEKQLGVDHHERARRRDLRLGQHEKPRRLRSRSRGSDRRAKIAGERRAQRGQERQPRMRTALALKVIFHDRVRISVTTAAMAHAWARKGSFDRPSRLPPAANEIHGDPHERRERQRGECPALPARSRPPRTETLSLVSGGLVGENVPQFDVPGRRGGGRVVRIGCLVPTPW